MRVGHLMRVAGYVEGPKIENQGLGRLLWFGLMPEVERRIKALQEQREDAQARLTDALLDDAERERLAATDQGAPRCVQRRTPAQDAWRWLTIRPLSRWSVGSRSQVWANGGMRPSRKARANTPD